jgi:pyocin large subunit-like protein
MRTRAILIAGLLLLSACDAGPSAVIGDGQGASPTLPAKAAPPASDAEASMPVTNLAPPPETVAPQTGAALPLPSGPRAQITKTAYGDWPLWSKSRKYSADDNAHYQYAHHGAEIGAKSYADFLAMAHGFVHAPPKGVQTLKRRNGDTLLYDPRQNIFAVMTRQGAPRILFRPRDGAAYWEQQKAIEASGGWRKARND